MALFRVLWSPKETFESLREKGGWVLALIVLSVLSAVVAFFQWPFVEQMLRDQFEAMPQEMPAEMIDMSLNFSKYSAWVGGAAAPALTMFFVGLLLYLLNLILRGEGTYMQFAKTSLYSYVPSLIGSLVATGLLYAADARTYYDMELTGGAFFEDKTGYAYAFAASFLDPFGIWSLAVLIIGAAVMMRRPMKKAALWIGGAWVLIRLGSAITLAMQSSMM